MLQSSGAISIGNLSTELQLSATTNISLNDARIRKMAKLDTAGTTISLASFYGKANFTYTLTQRVVGISARNAPIADGGSFYTWSRGYDIEVITPEGMTITGVKLYDSSGNLLASPSVTAISTVAPLLHRPSGYVVSKIWLGNGYKNTPSYAVYRVEVLASDGYVYELANHRNFNLQCTETSRNGRGATPNSWVNNSTATAYNGVVVAPNYP